MAKSKARRVAIIAGRRTPFVKAGAQFSELSPLELSVHAVRGLLAAVALDPTSIEELVWGRVLHDPNFSNPARDIVLQLQMNPAIRAHMVSNNCISGIHAMVSVADSIARGRATVGIAGGVESMSTAPVLFGAEAAGIFRRATRARKPVRRLKELLRLRPRHFVPQPLAVKEPSTGLSMGQHAELTAQQWQIGRDEQDALALRSHRSAAAATADGRLTAEIFPLAGIGTDTLIRVESSLDQLAALPPVFDPSPRGTITAGNSSPLTDGAAALLLMDEAYALAQGHRPLAVIKAVEFAALHPNDGLLMAPALAVPRLLQRTGLALGDFDLIEMHEAFAAQVACNLKAWETGWKEKAIGRVPLQKLNPLGSSIAVGHPFAATGVRIATTLAYEMARRQSRLGLISICAAGGMAAAMVLEETRK